MIELLKNQIDYLSEHPKKYLLVISDTIYRGITDEVTNIKKYLNENKIPYKTKFKKWNIYLENGSIIQFEQFMNINEERLRGYLFDAVYLSESINSNPMRVRNEVDNLHSRLTESGVIFDYKSKV